MKRAAIEFEEVVMDKTVTIVEQGRGPQLSTSRVTVQDLVPYFQEGCSFDEIQRWIPTLSHEEIAVAERYYRANQKTLDENEERIQQRSATRKNPEWVEEVARAARAEREAILQKAHAEKPNGAPV
jgi:uncharacterized protein (DUF433 family)